MIAALVLVTTCFLPPVDGPVVEPFDAPACRWCPGHRGLTFAVADGDPVRAVAAGTVTFSGMVAGTAYVVVLLADGQRVTYGELRERLVAEGEQVVAGQVVATATTHLHLGLRLGDRYIDPAPFLGVPGRHPRLVPPAGAPRRPARAAATLRCPAVTPGQRANGARVR
jgi:murein DD-endopeptidase MepM/ murein hydrolase activator NlpD